VRWKTVTAAARPAIAGTSWMATGAGADHGHPAPVDRDGRIPAGGVEGRPGEPRRARQRRDHRAGELADRRHQHVGDQLGAVGGVHHPVPAGGVPDRAGDLGVQPDPAGQAEIVGAPTQVRQDLGVRREPAAPGVVGGERVRVERRGDVARTPRIRVVAPHAADPVGPFQQHDVVEAGRGERGGRGDTTETRTDDQYARCGGSHDATVVAAAGRINRRT
jgi:hypothetical protein